MCLLKHTTGNEAIDWSSFLAPGVGGASPAALEGTLAWKKVLETARNTLFLSLLISQMSGGWKQWTSSSSSQIIRVLLWFFFKRIMKREGPSNFSHVGKASHISREEQKCSGNWPGFGPQPISPQVLEMLPHGEEGQASDAHWLRWHTMQLQAPT